MLPEVSNQTSQPAEEIDPIFAGNALLSSMIGDCKKCYNRRVLGFNITTGKPSFCTCYLKYMKRFDEAIKRGEDPYETLQRVQ